MEIHNHGWQDCIHTAMNQRERSSVCERACAHAHSRLYVFYFICMGALPLAMCVYHVPDAPGGPKRALDLTGSTEMDVSHRVYTGN